MAKYDSNWWFGKNSVWAQSGAKEGFTGVKESGTEGLFDNFNLKMEHDISKDQKMVLYAIVAFVLFKSLMK